MPIYEYECSHCGHQLEAIQKISDHPLVTCPECKNNSLKKLVSASKFVLKGQGWYETDFKHSSKPKTSEQKAEQTASAHQAESASPTSSAESTKNATKKEGTTTSESKKTDSTKSADKKSN